MARTDSYTQFACEQTRQKTNHGGRTIEAFTFNTKLPIIYAILASKDFTAPIKLPPVITRLDSVITG